MTWQIGSAMEYKIIFYEKENHETPTLDFLEALRIKAQKSKNARIQYKQAVLYIELLKKNGTFLPENITKHIEENIWELRPGNNRIFYFFHEQETFILLHTFMKKSNKTPKREILKAKRERNDYLIRKEHLNI